MYFQNIELFETEKFQYLLIHKNGSSSVRKCMERLNPVLTTEIKNNKIKWTVIRDPYERFISGLNYDLNRHNIDPTEINYRELFNGNINLKSRESGHVNHCISQVSYLINANIDYYVDIKDLHLFLKMHFGESECLKKNTKKSTLNIDKSEIMKYLNFDYYVYNKIKDSNSLWNWTQGKIF